MTEKEKVGQANEFRKSDREFERDDNEVAFNIVLRKIFSRKPNAKISERPRE